MGNHPSLESAAAQAHRPIQRLLRPSNALGLSKMELDKRCQPSGLYPTCPWDEKAIRRLIGDGKLAARMKGNEQRQPADCECPICFLNYSQINSTKCCQAHICTECFLQVRPQKDKSATCPFCNSPRVQVVVAQALDEQAILAREQEEQRVIEAEIRSRSGGGGAADADAPGKPLSSSSSAPEQAFGSSLEQNARVALLRARSSSVASESSSGHHHADVGVGDIAALAMTPEERALLEAEMKAQHSHPLAQRLQAEEEERRLRNELSYYQSQAARLRDLRARRELIAQTLRGGVADEVASAGSTPDRLSSLRNGRDWNRIVEAFENSGNGTVQSLDDLVVLEAAIMLSMDEETRRGGGGAGDTASNDSEFDAAQHASQGFPLARSRAAAAASGRPGFNSSEELTQHLQSLVRSLQSPQRRGRRDRRSRLGLLASDASLEAAAMLMRGISEEEQLAMAIAASLAESGPPSQGTPNTVEEANEDEEGDDGEEESGAAAASSSARPSTQWTTESLDPPGVSDVPLSAYHAYVRNITGESAVSQDASSSSSSSSSSAAAADTSVSQPIRLTLAVAGLPQQPAADAPHASDNVAQATTEEDSRPQSSLTSVGNASSNPSAESSKVPAGAHVASSDGGPAAGSTPPTATNAEN